MVEGVVNGGMDVEKTLRGSRRLEPLHLALSSPHDLMGVFSAVVLPDPLLMRAGQAKMPQGRAVGAELVGDQQLRREALFPQQLSHQPQRRSLVASALHQDVEDLALVIDGAP